MAITFAGIKALIAKAGQICDIKKPLQTIDDIGQTIRSFVDHKINVVCWQQEKSSSDITEDGKIFLSNIVSFYFDKDPEIFEGFLILFEGDSFIVQGITDQGGIGQLFKADMETKK